MREEDWRGISLSQLSLFVSYDFVAIDFVVAAADDGGMPRRRRNAGGHDVPPDAVAPLPLLPDDNDDIIADFPMSSSFSSGAWALGLLGGGTRATGSTNRYA